MKHKLLLTGLVALAVLAAVSTTVFAREPELGDDRRGSTDAQIINPSSGVGAEDRSSGSISSQQSDDFINGVKLRGDGTVDDSFSASSQLSDDFVNGVKLRGDGTVDDNSASLSDCSATQGMDDSPSSGKSSGSQRSGTEPGDDRGSGGHGSDDMP
jgi:hypothetical protein